MYRTPHSLLLASALLVVVSLLCSCSRFKTLDNSGRGQVEIGFTSSHTKVSGAEEVQSFDVWGTQTEITADPDPRSITIFDGTLVSQSAPGARDWSYDNIRYWIPGNFYSFHAIHPHPEGYTRNLTLRADNSASFPYSSLADAYGVDLMSAYHEREYDGFDASPVPLDFNHLLCRVRVKVVIGVSDPDQFTIKKVSFRSIWTSGTCAVSSSTPQTCAWTQLSVSGSPEKDLTSVVLDKDHPYGSSVVWGDECQAWGDEGFYAIPQRAANVRCVVRYDVHTSAGDETDKTASISLSDVTWEAGKVYTYTVLMRENFPIEIANVTVDKWGEEKRGATIIIK